LRRTICCVVCLLHSYAINFNEFPAGFAIIESRPSAVGRRQRPRRYLVASPFTFMAGLHTIAVITIMDRLTTVCSGRHSHAAVEPGPLAE
jgi:hypothetical protein